MISITLTINKANVYDEVAKTTSYEGKKMEEDKNAYERIFIIEEDRTMLERFWNEACNTATETFKRFIVSVIEQTDSTTMDVTKNYVAKLEVSSSYDVNLTNSIQASLFSFFVNASSYRNSNVLAAMFVRGNYNYQEKYLLSASLRREGSSRFGANNKWGWFPAASAGWRVSGEDFMKDQDWCNDLKVRLGFGITGNNLASDLRSVAMLSNSGTFWYNGNWVYTYGVSQNVNPDLKWEKKYEYNVGVDYSFLDNRLYGSLDVYYRQTRDLLWDYEVPTPPYQYPTLLANAGQMDSYGWPLS